MAARHSLSNVEAEGFVQMIVEVINDGLLRDRQVKIKGLGTFKLLTVKERTSVNVNTGEKVVIGEHDKVSFTPDNVMKDLVNKPFSQFETVPVDDDSPLLEGEAEFDIDAEVEESDDVDTDYVPAQQTESSHVIHVEEKSEKLVEHESVQQEEVLPESHRPNVMEPVVHKQESVNGDNLVEEEKPSEPMLSGIVENPVEDCSVEDCSVEDSTASEPADIDCSGESGDETQEECSRPNPRCRNIFIYYGVLINVIVAVAAFALGYFANGLEWFTVDRKEPIVIDSKKVAVTKNVKTQAVTVPSDTATTHIHVDKVKEKLGNVQDSIAHISEKKSKVEEIPLKGYDEDVRVRTGAYYIIGTDIEIVVKDGQTLKSISRTYLGEGMECYVEAYNKRTTVKKGDKIKIPKLKLKKSVVKK